VSDDVKKSFIQDYMKNQEAPKLLDTSTNTPIGVTATSDNPKMHTSKMERTQSVFSLSIFSTIIIKVLKLIINFLMMTTVGNVIYILVILFSAYAVIRLLYWLLKKLILKFRK
jgi:hypothetical protein